MVGDSGDCWVGWRALVVVAVGGRVWGGMGVLVRGGGGSDVRVCVCV